MYAFFVGAFMDNSFIVKNLCYAYLKKPLCLKDVSFSAEKNDKILILGLEDAGKTTLIKTLSGFDDKYFGSIKLFGKEIKAIPDEQKNVSLILDYPTLIGGSIEKNIDYVFKVTNKQCLSIDEKISMLKTFGLDFDLKTNIKKLSKFEQFKLCFLRSFLKKSEMICIDDILNNDFSSDELEELKRILGFVCEKKIVFLCASEKSYLKVPEFFDWFCPSMVLYLNLAQISQHKNIYALLDNPRDLDACAFNVGLQQKEGYCVKQDGEFYVSVDDGVVVKIDRKLNEYFEKLNLADNENEDIVLCFSRTEDIDFCKNNEVNRLFADGRIFVFSKLDRRRVL